VIEINSPCARSRNDRRHPAPVTSIVALVSRIRRHATAWFAIIAMLAGTLAPAAGRATVPGDGGRFLADLCSVSRTGAADSDRTAVARVGDSARDGGGESRPVAHAADRCPSCCSHAGLAIPGAPVAAPLYAFPGGTPSPRLRSAIPWTGDAWPPVQPRAPPADA
jgi:hypothetical protein